MALETAMRRIKSLLGLEQGRVGLDRVVELAHRHLGLEVVFVAEVSADTWACRAVAGDAASFNVTLGEGIPADATYSQLLTAGELANLIPDTSAVPRLAQLPWTRKAGIGAFIGVPLQLSDGTLYGTLCGMDHNPDHTLGERDVRFMTMLAELMVFDLDEQRRLERLSVNFWNLIETDNVDIACQPIIDLGTGDCLGVEALARFPAPFGSPDQTFADAEDVGLGLEIERLAIREAWKLLPRLRPEQFLALNVSPSALLELAGRAQKRDDLPLGSLVVEITEQSVVHSYADLRNAVAPLRQNGLRLAIDDAGAGYASLHHIVELRPDFIKVDRSLVDGVADDHARRVAVSAFVLLSLDLGAMVVAEGVESPRDLAAVCDLGVHAAQGYLLGRPSTNRDDLTRWTEGPPRQMRGAPRRVHRQPSPG
ncbi:MAG TPA: EAL domain-containing protein [Acidimicrobiales bacterium]|nr:EAL domain-containing protein [Acidimicrobiales bacterium]